MDPIRQGTVCGLQLLTMNSSKQRPPALFKLSKTCLPTPFWTQPSLLLKWLGRCQDPTDTVALLGFTADWPLTVEVIGVNGVNSRISMKLMLVSWSLILQHCKAFHTVSIPFLSLNILLLNLKQTQTDLWSWFGFPFRFLMIDFPPLLPFAVLSLSKKKKEQ